ncbi:hypothetical protein J2W14_002727 [Pseudarthrobacter oxydans]|uniref:hypothetical protein n=1 Tax=Pseudarthrobacter oxydans TaxID=1671 RepID=UPI00278340A5|nr:hypothetical protein [Pseudarthrobacter oxydans]MDP9983314.1 hypothetical protein [Pseudarthrobacter oxydans]
MSLNFLRKKTMMAALLGLVLIFTGMQGATAAVSETDQEIIAKIKTVVANIEGAGLTGADKAFLAQHPEIADKIVDPSKTTHSVKVSKDQVQTMASCYYSDRYSIWRSITGGIVYQYHTAGNFCYTGYSSSVNSNYGYFDRVDGIYVVQNSNEVNNRIASGSATILHTQGKINECILYYGCFQSFYPWGKTTIYANGAMSFQYGG